MTTLAPCPTRNFMVGSDAQILPSSVITPSDIGTLRSQRSSTVFEPIGGNEESVRKTKVCSLPKQ